MYLVFIDEAGNSAIPKEEKRNPDGGTSLYLTFAAAIMDMRCMHDIEIKHKTFKQKFLSSSSLEAKWGTKQKELKNGTKREDYRKEYAELINGCDILISSVVINKYKASETSRTYGMYRLGFEQLLKQLREFQVSTDFAELALIVDSINDGHDGMVAEAYHEALLLFQGTPGFFISRYSPSIVFAKSTHSPGLQLVDFCASSIHRSVEAKDPTYASMFRDKLFSRNNTVYGYGFSWIPQHNRQN